MLPIAENVALNVVAIQGAVQPTCDPSIVGKRGTILLNVDGWSSGEIGIEGSDDGVNYAPLLTVFAQGPTTMKDIIVPKFLRFNVLSSGAGGKGSAYLIGSKEI